MKKSFGFLALSAIFLISACADEKVVPQKSPCVGLEGSPCGPKRAINGKPRDLSEHTKAAARKVTA